MVCAAFLYREHPPAKVFITCVHRSYQPLAEELNTIRIAHAQCSQQILLKMYACSTYVLLLAAEITRPQRQPSARVQAAPWLSLPYSNLRDRGPQGSLHGASFLNGTFICSRSEHLNIPDMSQHQVSKSTDLGVVAVSLAPRPSVLCAGPPCCMSLYEVVLLPCCCALHAMLWSCRSSFHCSRHQLMRQPLPPGRQESLAQSSYLTVFVPASP